MTVTDTVVKTCPTALSALVCVTHLGVSWYNRALTARYKEWVAADVGRGEAVDFSKSVMTENEHMERKKAAMLAPSFNVYLKSDYTPVHVLGPATRTEWKTGRLLITVEVIFIITTIIMRPDSSCKTFFFWVEGGWVTCTIRY